MSQAANNANTGLQAGAAVGGAVAGIGIAAGAVNAVPIAGQVVSAALGLAAVFTQLFAGQGPKAKRKKREDAAKQFMQQRQARMKAFNTPQPQMPTQAAPPTQGMGNFQQMQQTSQAPIYSSQGGAQPTGGLSGR